MRQELKDIEKRMGDAVAALKDKFKTLRTGRANLGLLDGITVSAYGTDVPINQVANVTVSDAHTLSLQVWDKGLMGHVEKAIRSANLGLNPVNDGQAIRVPMPPLTEERRKEIVKLVKKFGEEAKVAVRNIRRDAMEHLKKAEKDQHFSEDDRKRGEDEVQKKTDSKTKEIDNIVTIKDKEVMAV